MQVVDAAFTAEEKDKDRSVKASFLASWKTDSTLGGRTFTIGTSLIGGNDIIGINPGAIGSPGIYRYFDESDYLLSVNWERGLNMPVGGLTKAMAEVSLDNTSGRFTPRYMGGNSELFTSAYLPQRPVIINAGFDVGGIDYTIPQFAGLTNKPAQIDKRQAIVKLTASDYVNFFQNRYLDQSAMFTGLRTDQWLSYLFGTVLGMSTAQYDLDYGINQIPFGYFPAGTKFADVVNQLVEAENAHLYQDESGIFKFENRQHWDSSPYNAVQKLVLTGQVIDSYAPDFDHLINVVEVNAKVRTKQPQDIIFKLDASSPILVGGNSSKELFVNTDDPILAFTVPTSSGTVSYFKANSEPEGDGTDLSSSISFTTLASFGQAIKFNITNSSSTSAYVTTLQVSGRTAKETSTIYHRAKDDSSVTAYQEQKYVIDNPFINNESWAASLARMILNDFSEPENLQRIVIRAIPELQLGDLISWQGRYWRVFDIKSTLDPSVGFVQELLLLQRAITTYFRIGISTIAGTDRIAP